MLNPPASWCYVKNICGDASLNLPKQRLYKLGFVEKLKVIDFFAYSNKANGDFEFIRNTDHYSPFRSAIEFGNDNTIVI